MKAFGAFGSSLVFFVACSSSETTPAATGADAGGDAAIDGGSSGAATATGTIEETITIKGASPKPGCLISLDVAGVEDRSLPWLCPDCKTIYRAPFSPKGDTTCVKSTLGDRLPTDVYFGWSAAGFHLVYGYGYADDALGTVTETTTSADGMISLDKADLSRAGSVHLKLGTSTDAPFTLAASAMYSCGWPKTNPPAYAGNYRPKIGDKLPDAVLQDQCGDAVRLHDLLGRYLVFAMNQTETGCGPCDQAVAGQPKFEADMKAAGIETLVVALDVPSYTVTHLSPTPGALKDWVAAKGVAGIALADRGYFNDVLGLIGNTGSGVGLPAFTLVAPDGSILSAEQGFNPSPSTWDTLATKIHTHSGK